MPAFSSLNQPLRLAVCLNVRRVGSLDRLLAGFLLQGGGQVHIFAALRGITKDYWRELVLPLYEEWPGEGRLTLRYYPDKNRLAALLDTVREVDVSGYDLFLFPREDLLCSPGLLERIKHAQERAPGGTSFHDGGMCRRLVERRGVEYAEVARLPEASPLYVLTREALELLQECERNPARIANLYPDGVDPKHGAYGEDPDALVMQVIRHLGSRDLSSVEAHIPPLLPLPPTRPDPLAEQKETLYEAAGDDPARAEYLVELEFPDGKDYFRHLGMAGCRVKTGEKATVLRSTERELLLDWERGGRELYVRELPEGPYRRQRPVEKTSGRKKGTAPSSGLADCALGAHGLRWGVCAVALPRESFYWLRDWVEFHLRAGARLVALYDNTGSKGSLRGDTPFCGGALQREGRSKRNEEYGRLTAHLSDEDIRKELYGLAARYGEERVKIIPWQPRDPKSGKIVHGQVEAYEDFLCRFRHELDWCAFIDPDEYLWCRKGQSIGGLLERAERETPEVGRIVMKGWKFRMRWTADGPRDIRHDRAHLPLCDGGEKNLVRMDDVVKADIHWYWEMKPGIRHMDADPYEWAFCHYNCSDEEMEKQMETPVIVPRSFLEEESINSSHAEPYIP